MPDDLGVGSSRHPAKLNHDRLEFAKWASLTRAHNRCTVPGEPLGSGDPVLFIHGCPTFPDVLDPIARAVARTHLAMQVALPGYGASAPLTPPFSIADIHAAIESTVAPLLGGRPLSVIGFSGGAYHAFALAVRGNLPISRVDSLAGSMSQAPTTRDGFKQFAAALRRGLDLHGIAPERFLSPGFRVSHPEAVRQVTAFSTRYCPS